MNWLSGQQTKKGVVRSPGGKLQRVIEKEVQETGLARFRRFLELVAALTLTEAIRQTERIFQFSEVLHSVLYFWSIPMTIYLFSRFLDCVLIDKIEDEIVEDTEKPALGNAYFSQQKTSRRELTRRIGEPTAATFRHNG